MPTSEKLRRLYDNILCEISFCMSVEEILQVIDDEFVEAIDYEKQQETLLC